MLDEGRKKHEGNLANDKERAAWAPLLKYHHGVALLEAGKPAEARGLFDQVAQQGPDKPMSAEAALRGGQCRLIEGKQRVEAARQKLGAAKPEERATAQKAVEDGLNGVREAGRYLETQADAFKPALPNGEARARMYYDAAWAYRYVAELEVAAGREKQQADLQKKLPPGAKPVEVARPDIPLQPAEEKARSAYKSLIAAFADLPLTAEARFELAELYAERSELDPAIQVLKEALDKEPPQELTDRIRLRLGTCLAAKKDSKAALPHFDSITDPKNPLTAQATYRAGECLIDQGDFAKAAARLAVFRDKGDFQNIAGLTDRALLRLGYALAKAEQWEPSRQAYETLTQRFGNSPWVIEARYGIGWARQKQRQFDEAVNAYNAVVNATTNELAAKAQLQIGLCRMEQKRFAEATSALLIVATTYDFPELTAAALLEASRGYSELKNREQAEHLLQRILRDHAGTEWAKWRRNDSTRSARVELTAPLFARKGGQAPRRLGASPGFAQALPGAAGFCKKVEDADMNRILKRLLSIFAVIDLLACAGPAMAYVEAPHSLGSVVQQSTNIIVCASRRWTRKRTSSSTARWRTSRASTRPTSSSTTSAAAGFDPREWQDVDGVGRGRQDGRLLPQRRRQRDVHRQLLVPGLRRRRVVEA